MKRETIIWIVVMLVAGGFLLYRAAVREQGMAKAYVQVTEQEFVNVAPAGEEANWVAIDSPPAQALDAPDLAAAERRVTTEYEPASQQEYVQAQATDPTQTEYRFSLWRSIGIWVAAFFTLAIFSFIYRDNPFYKLAESVFVGVSAAYWMVVGFWTVIVPNLIGKIWPALVQAWALPGLSGRDTEANYWYIAPLALGLMLLWRLSPVGGWIARWPLAFIIGVFCGLRLISFLHADFLSQIRNSIVPLVVYEGGEFMPWDSLANVFLFVGVLSCLVYFFFSFEHKGFVGKTARLGIWFLMITFGAGFGYTVMGRIALLAIRIEFLFDDWLWLIDPTDKRAALAAMGLL